MQSKSGSTALLNQHVGDVCLVILSGWRGLLVYLAVLETVFVVLGGRVRIVFSPKNRGCGPIPARIRGLYMFDFHVGLEHSWV